jgi:hypothetical protein
MLYKTHFRLLSGTDSNGARWLIKLIFLMWTKSRKGDGIFKRLISQNTKFWHNEIF